MAESNTSNGKKPTLEEIIQNYEREAERQRGTKESARASDELPVAFPENLFGSRPEQETPEKEAHFPAWTGEPKENGTQGQGATIAGEPSWQGIPAPREASFSDSTKEDDKKPLVDTPRKASEVATTEALKREETVEKEKKPQRQSGKARSERTAQSTKTEKVEKPKKSEQAKKTVKSTKSEKSAEPQHVDDNKRSDKWFRTAKTSRVPSTETAPLTVAPPHDELSVPPIISSASPSMHEKGGMREQNEALLASLRSRDIRGTSSEKARGKALQAALRRGLMAILLLVILVSSLNLVRSLHSRRVADRFYTDLREHFYSDGIENAGGALGYLAKDGGSVSEARLYSDEGDIYEAPDLATVDLHTLYERMLPNLESLKEVNTSIFGWIKVEGTRVDYPVVKSPVGNNDYYLTHALDRTYSDAGSIFMDYNNATDLSRNRNTCIYGHNMNDGTMFQTIMNFRTLNQFQNGTIQVYTANGIYLFTPFSVYDATPTESFFKVAFESDAAFSDFITEIKGKSIFRSNVSVTTADRIVTLITCTNTLVDKRFVVHGVLTETVK